MINITNINRAYSEVSSFLDALGEEYKKKIPINLRKTIEKEKDPSYNPKFSKDEEIKEGMLSKEALALISAFYLQYWCEDKNEKEELKEIYVENGKKETNKNSENIFNRSLNNSTDSFENKIDYIENLSNENNEKEELKEKNSLVIYNENIIMKIWNKIISFFRK